MAITRRQFIKRAGIFTAGTLVGNNFLTRPFLRQAVADTIGDRYFVSFYLDGGNDGLNTVVPYGNGPSGNLRQWYEASRGIPPANGTGGIRVLTSELNNTLIANDPGTGAGLGLHPGFRNGTTGGLHRLYQQGKVAVIQGVGYPNPNLSHEQSTIKWETGDPLGTAGYGTGWVGRHLAANYVGSAIPAFCVRSTVAGDFAQTTTSVLAVSRIQNFTFPHDSEANSQQRARHATAFQALYNEALASPHPLLGYTGSIGRAAFQATQVYPLLHTEYRNDRRSWNDQYADTTGSLGTSTARDLREVAKVIYGVINGRVNTRFFSVRNGGYDTHSDQGGGAAGGQHYDLHKEVSDAVELFYEDCRDMGVANKLCILIWSEFSRRVQQNDNGTDHGSQGPVFAVGGSVVGGVYGKHPNINPANLDDGNTRYYQGPLTTAYRSTDIRDVYGTVLTKWMSMPTVQVDALLPLDPSGDPLSFWRSRNYNVFDFV
jgi:uncharacterized protein (DUF1501 family)